jgi:ferredoxin
MLRTIIKIDEEKCNGCGLCVNACHEGAISLVDGKAKLIRDDYCDGLGNCLPVCPTNAITFEEREALAFDEEAVQKMLEEKQKKEAKTTVMAGCPGSRMATMKREKVDHVSQNLNIVIPSRLNQWPVQIKLVAPKAPYFTDCDLLIAADCTAFAYGNFHNDFMKDRITLIGCPKLDDVDYSDKLTDIFAINSVKSVTVLRMEVPCCGGIEYAVKTALENSNKNIPCTVVTLTTDGNILS